MLELKMKTSVWQNNWLWSAVMLVVVVAVICLAVWSFRSAGRFKNAAKTITRTVTAVTTANATVNNLVPRVQALEDRIVKIETRMVSVEGVAKDGNKFGWRALSWLTEKFGPADEAKPKSVLVKQAKKSESLFKKNATKNAAEKNPWKGYNDPNVILPEGWR